MARLHYTLVKVALGADIDDNDTAITLAAPLREFGTTDIATISAPDTLALRVGYEIMHVTAYTSGASTATVARGQEGSTATAHNEGDILRHVLTDLDLSGGGAVDSVNAQTGVVVLDAGDIGITDAGAYFTGADVEAALQELGAGGASGDFVTYVEHGAVAGTARPAVPGPVLWIGTVVPTFIEANDILLDPDASGSIAAEDITFTPAGTIAATNVQAAIEEVAAEAGGGGGTFVKRAYQSLTTKSTWGAVNTREQWGTEEAVIDDADLPTLTAVTVYASVRGEFNNWTSNSLLRVRVEISLDGGATWNQGADNWARQDAMIANDRLPYFNDHQVTGTVTGDIQARVMAETDVISTPVNLNSGRIAMEVIV